MDGSSLCVVYLVAPQERRVVQELLQAAKPRVETPVWQEKCVQTH